MLHGAVQGGPQTAVVAVVVVDEAEDALVEGVHMVLDQFRQPFELEGDVCLEDVLPTGHKRANRQVRPILLASLPLLGTAVYVQFLVPVLHD